VNEFVTLSLREYEEGHTLSPAAVRWRHKRNPTRESIAVVLRSESRAIGRIWVQFRHWVLRDRNVVLASPIDFLVEERERNVTSFLQLFSVASRVVRENADGLFHTSNPITDGLYKKLFKLKPITELSAVAIPIRPISLMRRPAQSKLLRKSLHLRVIGNILSRCLQLLRVRLTTGVEPDDSVKEAISNKFYASQQFCSIRSPELLRWRFEGADEFDYKVIWLYEGRECLGYVAVSSRDIDGKRVLFVVDLMLSRQVQSREVRQLWLIVFQIATELDRDLVTYFYNPKNPTQKKYARFPMVRVPRRMMPQRIPIFVKIDPREFDAEADLYSLSSGYFTLFDLDLI